jgi:hypothetical protein
MDFKLNKKIGTRDNVPIGSKYKASSHARQEKVRKHSSVLLDPIE